MPSQYPNMLLLPMNPFPKKRRIRFFSSWGHDPVNKFRSMWHKPALTNRAHGVETDTPSSMAMLVEHINTWVYVDLGIHVDLSSSFPFKRCLPQFLSTVDYRSLTGRIASLQEDGRTGVHSRSWISWRLDAARRCDGCVLPYWVFVLSWQSGEF